MAELAHFKNFAKLKDTSVEFNDITVLAGKPGTGKSYVMKFMYAVDKSIDLSSIEVFTSIKVANDHLLKYIEIVKEFEEAEKDSDIEKVHKVKIELEILKNETTKSFDMVKDGKFEEKINGWIQGYLKNLIDSIFQNIEQISSNFDIKSDSYTIVCRDSKIEKFLFSFNNKKVETPTIYADFSNYTNQFQQEPVFVETPLILEFKAFMKREKGKTPYHIESLLNILDTDYSFTDEEQDKLIKSFREKSQAIIGGDIESSGDSFIFNRKDDKNYDILNASSGIKSIGLLQYLVTNKALKKGSILFWEEPEVHLHPQWQLKMVDLFVELMNAGVKIVFSTHSPYMADYLNAISKKGNYRDRVSFNVLDEKDGIVTNHILDDDNWDILQKELMDTFEDILWQYL